ncbi:MFS transporter, PPP family, 3-phenylpropionic acid transporter [Rhizobium sp. RU20A]|uniref:MFS transporter n=1 Tax=Rhizobium sp. RU20A TaxID=1907412 RepID=UPI0009572F3E|nr:MFS transporter [Rhizobium sp. RU20A]SIQ09638.1 MFS transporter, PPP family, 3-phenylpropionic acid transporter [Rhizobium sp. RU20A]
MTPASPAVSREDAPRFFEARIALLFCAPLIVNGVAMPFLPVWLHGLSLSDNEIGILLGLPMFIRVLTAPVAGIIADRIRERAHVLIVSAVLALAMALSLFHTHSFLAILIVYGLHQAVFSPYLPITEAITLTGVRRWRYDYGRMRFWGSLAFIGATMVGGVLIGRHGGDVVLPMMAVGCFLMIVTALLAPRVGRPRQPTPLAGLASPPARALRQFDLQLLMLGVALVNGSHAMLFAFSAIYWQEIGFSGTAIAVLWSAGVFAEVLVFIFARALLLRFSLWTMIFTGCFLAVLRWILFPHDLGFPGYFVLQCFHAFTFATMHVGMQNMLVRRVAEQQEASAQGLYFFYNGSFTALLTLVSGSLFALYHVQAFYMMSVVAAVGCGLALCGWRLRPGRNTVPLPT